MVNRSRWITVALALGAATSFALAVQTAWWSVGEAEIGPFGTRACLGGECAPQRGLTWLGGSELWMRSAAATRGAGYIAMFVLLMFAGAIAAKRQPKLIARGVMSALLTTTVTGVYFALAFPGIGGARVSTGVLEFAAALVLGIASVVTFLRRRPA